MKKENNKKRILVLNYEFPPLGGGGGVASYKLAKGFIGNGYEVDYLTSWFKGLKKFEIINGINVYRVKVFGRKKLETATMVSMLSYPFCAFAKGFFLCLRNKYDFINTQFVIPTGPLGFILSKIFRIKNILSLHGGDVYNPTTKNSPHKNFILKVVVKFLLNRVNFIIAQSSNTKNNAIKYYNPKKEIKIIPLPYEFFDFKKVSRKELNMKENKKYIIGAGRLIKRKGFEYFIKALALLDNNVNGIIIGNGPEKENLLKLARELKIENRLCLTGLVSEEKKFQYLCNSDIFVLSSIHEGFGIVIQEAMQVGLPVVATNNGGQVDLIRDGENGLLIDPKNFKKITEKVKKLLSNHKLKEKISKQNLSDINNFNLNNITEQYLNLLKINES
ncbi:glycosyltransferase family 4 protein [Candidatus Parcubacteria bacterium]|nr:glycosyltransferase family 4 protein [Candidatus Parcubacteria bacterium]